MQILFADEHYVAVDKPSGMLVHRRGGDRHEAAALQLVRDEIGRHVYPVHRLDRSTSGVLVFATSPEAAALLSAQFTARTVDKRYLAVVRGWPAAHGVIDYALVKEPDGPSQEAITEFVRLQTVEIDEAVPPHPTARYAWLSLRPRTGRTHQLRRHMAHLRHPIVGDVRHGDGRHNRVFRRRFDSHRLLLWATELRFEHPFTAQRVELRAPPCRTGPLDALGFTTTDEGGAPTS